jgi:CheY-like chemotaxis protein
MKRVLIVEDEIFVALEVEHVVRSLGLEVSAIAPDRESALQAANDSDIALVDLNLRDGATGTSIGALLAHQHGVRVIYVTANPGQIETAGGTLGVISKPFASNTIRDALNWAATDPLDVAAYPANGFTPFTTTGTATGSGSRA